MNIENINKNNPQPYQKQSNLLDYYMKSEDMILY